jgi:ribosomal protein S18 acetylase RimI-like enzyme
MVTPSLRRAAPRDVDLAVAVAARAFWDDPLFNVFFPDLLRQHRLSPGFFKGTIDDCVRHGEVWLAELDGTVAGVACWLPPGVGPATSGARSARQSWFAMPSVLRSSKRRVGLALINEIVKHHPHEEHWYLAVLCTDPRFQGRGVGRALLEPMLARADEAGVITYLETQKESNLAYYRGHGFDMTDVVLVSGSPPVWTMTRPVREGAS